MGRRVDGTQGKMSSKGDLCREVPQPGEQGTGCRSPTEGALHWREAGWARARVPCVAGVTEVQARCRDGVFQVKAGAGTEPHVYSLWLGRDTYPHTWAFPQPQERTAEPLSRAEPL